MWCLLACATPFEPAVSERPFTLPEETVPSPPAPARLLLDEVQAANDSTVMDPSFEFPDWVELYNADTVAIDLTTARLSTGADARDDAAWVGTGTLAPGERLFLWADGQDAPGHLPFALDADGERLTLSVHGVVTDRLATGEMDGDTAWARYPDGGAWAYTARPTPNAPNGSDPGPSTDPSDTLFPDPLSGGGLLAFSLTIPPAAVTALDRDPYGEVEGSLAWGPVWFRRVGIRRKGVYGSLRSMSAKAAFKIDLNAFDDHHLRGLETLTFNNMVQDPSYVHEALAYTFFRSLGLPAPRTAWMRLTVNGEDWGLYLHVESVDDTFLARWWANPDGALYEGAYGVDFVAGEELEFEYDEGPDPTDRSDITAVAAILDGDATDAAIEALEERVDMDQILREMAVEAVTLHWDGYTTANNYRVYHDPDTDRFSMIPWGTDQTFHDSYYGAYDGYGRLLTFCLDNAGCAERYDLALLDVADAFETADLNADLDAWTTWLAPEIATDPRAEVGADVIATWTADTRTAIADAPARIRGAVVGR
jgi:hypothetical protein